MLDLQKICTNNHNGWAFERVAGFELREHEKRLVQSPTSQDCMQACVWEQKFQCRSINYESKTGECWLSDMNRHTVNINTEIRSQKYGPSSGNIDYYEFNCIQGKLTEKNEKHSLSLNIFSMPALLIAYCLSVY